MKTRLRKYATLISNGDQDGFAAAEQEYDPYIREGRGCIEIDTPDQELNNFVNHWLPRQVYYHGITNRLTTDPQTRNFVQDHMGMVYIKPEIAQEPSFFALSQQKSSGPMPDGIVLVKGAELKYINQVPHTDHCVWLPICLRAYLDETDDVSIWRRKFRLPTAMRRQRLRSIFDRAMNWLLRIAMSAA